MLASIIRPPESQLHDDRLGPPLGPLYLAAALSKSGISTTVVDLCGGRSFDEIPRSDLYGISTFTTSYPAALEILRYIRDREPHAVVVVGGPHVNAVGDKVLVDGFDYAFIGEGEITFPLIAGAMARRQHEARVTMGQLAEDLDELGFSYDFADMASYTRKVMDRQSTIMLTSRGCPYRCRFCWTPNNLGAVRFHSARWVREQLMHLRERYGLRAVTFHDDSFLANKERALAVMDCLEELQFIWRAECNVAHLEPAVCRRMVESGCKHVFTGIESGSPSMLRAMKKPQTQEIIRRGITAAVDAGLIVRASLMVGFPSETWDTIRESADFLCDLPFQEYSLYNFAPFPGTEPYEFPERFGIRWISDDYNDFYLLKGFNEGGYSFATDTITPELIQEWRDYMIARLDERHTASVVVEGKWTVGSER